MQLLVNVLRDDRADTEITNYALETLISVTSPQETVRQGAVGPQQRHTQAVAEHVLTCNRVRLTPLRRSFSIL